MPKIYGIHDQPKIAYLAHQAASGTTGPGTVATTWTTRVLNTIVSDTYSIITSLTSNQFILQPGTYDIFADAQENSMNGMKLRLRNITASSTAIVGDSSFSAQSNTVQPMVVLNGQVVITVATTFELQYYSTTATGSASATSSAEVEQFTLVKITKIK